MESVEQAREVLSAAEGVLGAHAIVPGFGDDDLDSATTALSAVRRTLSECLAAEADEKDPARARQIAALLMRSEHAQAMVLDAVLARRAAKVLTVRDALGRLRQARSTADLVERAAAEAHYMGFDRILFSRIGHGLWLPSSAYARADEGFAHTLVEAGLAHPRKLTGALLEGEMVRRGAPIVVRNPQSNPRVYTELVALTETKAYVAAPVLAWGQPIVFSTPTDSRNRSWSMSQTATSWACSPKGLALPSSETCCWTGSGRCSEPATITRGGQRGG
jgi:hypothetical protein